MFKSKDPSRAQIELEVQESVLDVERAFAHLHEKLSQSHRTLDLLKSVQKKPLVLSATTFLVGVYIGSALFRSMERAARKPLR